MSFQSKKINVTVALIAMILVSQLSHAQLNLITDIPNRNTISLDVK